MNAITLPLTQLCADPEYKQQSYQLLCTTLESKVPLRFNLGVLAYIPANPTFSWAHVVKKPALYHVLGEVSHGSGFLLPENCPKPIYEVSVLTPGQANILHWP